MYDALPRNSVTPEQACRALLSDLSNNINNAHARKEDNTTSMNEGNQKITSIVVQMFQWALGAARPGAISHLLVHRLPLSPSGSNRAIASNHNNTQLQLVPASLACLGEIYAGDKGSHLETLGCTRKGRETLWFVSDAYITPTTSASTSAIQQPIKKISSSTTVITAGFLSQCGARYVYVHVHVYV